MGYINLSNEYLTSKKMVNRFQLNLDAQNIEKKFNKILFYQDELLHLCDRFILFTIEEIYEMFDELKKETFNQKAFLEEFSDIILYLFSFSIELEKENIKLYMDYKIDLKNIKLYDNINFKSYFEIKNESLVPTYNFNSDSFPNDFSMISLIEELLELRKYFPSRKYHRNKELLETKNVLNEIQNKVRNLIEITINNFYSYFNNREEADTALYLLLKVLREKQESFI